VALGRLVDHDELLAGLGVRTVEDGRQLLVVVGAAQPLLAGVAPVSIVLIAVATSSTWPNSSAAMLATRS
jgi:hypothetical protein